MSFRPTPRKFLQASAAVLSRSLLDHASALAPTPTESSREVPHEFPYGTVSITGGPLKEQYDRTHADYLGLDNDRLLKVYRQRAGMLAPGPDMGGWYDTDGFVPGHSMGQYISGPARIGAATGDPGCATKVRNSSAASAPRWARRTTPSSARRRICGFATPSTSISPA
jgi:uncharacterized protein